MSLNLCLFVHSGVQQILCCVLLLFCFVTHPLMYPTQTCLPLPFWRKAHDFLGYLTPLRLLSISLRFGTFAVFPESFRFPSVISLRFRIL
jgi:hypothetical protein